MPDPRSIVARIKGPLVPITPAFADDEALDLDSTCKWLDWVVGQGIGLIWLTPGTSRYMAMSDQEIWDLTEAAASVTRGRALLIAATASQWPLHQCREYLKHCAKVGADIVKICPGPPGPGGAESTLRFFQDAARDAPLPLFAYTLAQPGGGHLLSPDVLKRLLDTPQYVGMKNDSGDFYEHRQYLRTAQAAGVPFACLTGGSMMSFLWGYDYGAQAFCGAYGIVAPKIPIQFYEHLVNGRRAAALDIVHRYEEPFLDETISLGGWQAVREVAVHRGHFRSRQDRYPFPTLNDEQAAVIVAHFERQHLL